MSIRSLHTETAGFSLVELLVALGVTTVIMGATMVGLTDAVRVNESATQITGMNSMLRASMDRLVLDLMQTGTGLPPDHLIGKPSGDQAQEIYLPGPPGTELTAEFIDDASNGFLAAVIPGPGYGPEINGVETDMITVMMADDSLFDIKVKNITPTSVDADDASIDFEDPPYNVAPGQLIVVWTDCGSTLVQVTNVLNNGKIMFSANDSMNLNQPQAKEGSLSAIKDCDEATILRMRMISYYIDATTNPNRPRLVRRINNGDPDVLDNDLGTAVALDIENLQFSYDIVVGTTVQSNVEAPADPSQIRKVNVTLSARSKNATFGSGSARVHRNTLNTQISLRGMALADNYLGTVGAP